MWCLSIVPVPASAPPNATPWRRDAAAKGAAPPCFAMGASQIAKDRRTEHHCNALHSTDKGVLAARHEVALGYRRRMIAVERLGWHGKHSALMLTSLALYGPERRHDAQAPDFASFPSSQGPWLIDARPTERPDGLERPPSRAGRRLEMKRRAHLGRVSPNKSRMSMLRAFGSCRWDSGRGHYEEDNGDAGYCKRGRSKPPKIRVSQQARGSPDVSRLNGAIDSTPGQATPFCDNLEGGSRACDVAAMDGRRSKPMPLVQGCLLAHAVFLDDPCLNAHNGTLDVESRPSARHVPTRPPILYGSYSVDGSCDREGRMEDSRARRADIDDGMRSLSGDDCIVSRSKRLFAGPDVTSGRPLFPVNDPRRHLHRSSTCPADKTNSTGPYSAEDDAERPVTGMSGRETRAVMVETGARAPVRTGGVCATSSSVSSGHDHEPTVEADGGPSVGTREKRPDAGPEDDRPRRGHQERDEAT
ncbi:hypothetical protein PCL_05168 [Purpureocillium lilacinum]|uniref:Uncharacterized protein n=1 Tax=Purpureocillium lilacinum TaxID=33203 RepID=A0A2U3DW40_PURLI|nr:hypothetical protein PCL_05168 [Purpureocillium lilacinum]